MLPPNDNQPPGARSSDDLSGLQILLVEDSPDIGELVKADPQAISFVSQPLKRDRSDRAAARTTCAGYRDLGLDRVSSADLAQGASDAGKAFYRSAVSGMPALSDGEKGPLS